MAGGLSLHLPGAFDEIKNHFLGTAKGKQPTHFRSKNPEGVYQEIYGMLISYNLIRDLMCEAAKTQEMEPLQISFVNALHLLRIWLPTLERPKRLMFGFSRFLHDLSQCVLRERRPRSSPRKVKKPRKRFCRKQPNEKEQKAPTSVDIVMGEAA